MGLYLQRGGALGANNQPSSPDSMDCHKGFTLGLFLASMPPPQPMPSTPSRGLRHLGCGGQWLVLNMMRPAMILQAEHAPTPSPSPICLLGSLPSLGLLLSAT